MRSPRLRTKGDLSQGVGPGNHVWQGVIEGQGPRSPEQARAEPCKLRVCPDFRKNAGFREGKPLRSEKRRGSGFVETKRVPKKKGREKISMQSLQWVMLEEW